MTAQSWLQGQLIETHSFTNLNKAIPDGKAYGMSDIQTVSSDISNLTAVRIKLQIAGEFNGDIYGYVRHIQGGTTNYCVLLNRVGRSAEKPAGYADPGMNVVFDDDAGLGDIHLYRNVINLPTGSPLNGSWQPDGRKEDPGFVTDKSDRTTKLKSFTKASGSGEWTLYLADLESGGTNTLVGWELQLSGIASPTITWSTPSDIIYGAELSAAQLNASASVAGTFAYNPPIGTKLNAGKQTLSVTFTPANPANYGIVNASNTINVLRKSLTVLAHDTSRSYGTPNPAFDFHYEGFINGEAESVINGTPVLGTVADVGSSSGAYPIQVDASRMVASNYNFVPVNGTLTITKANSTGRLSSSLNPALPGTSVAFSYALDAVAPGIGTPTGDVQFKVNGINEGGPVPLNSGQAILRTSSLLHGYSAVSALYLGDKNFNGTTNTLIPEQLINSPPMAASITIWRNPGDGVKISIATLLSSIVDADKDLIKLVKVDTVSAYGGGILLNTEWLLYTPALHFTNVDSYKYTVTDGFDEPITGTVTVNVLEDVSASPNLVISNLNNGDCEIRGNGIPGRIYRIEFCEDLNRPLWQPLGNVTTDPSGVFLYGVIRGMPQRFYRSAYP